MSVNLHGRVAHDKFAVDIDLDVDEGETVALLGPNGSGKSTVLRCIAGLEDLASGELSVQGTTYDSPSGRTAPQDRSVAMVFQDHRLFDHLTVRDNVAFGLAARRVGKRQLRSTTLRMLELFELDKLAEREPATLSGGQRARVAFARAMAPSPAVLLLDEPFAAIDVETRRALRHSFGELAATTTVVLVTHDPVEARVLADQLVVLDTVKQPGTIVSTVAQSGPPAEVAARPATPFVAELLGTNLLTGTAANTVVTLESGATLTTAKPATGEVHLTFSPTAVTLHRTKPEGGSARNLWAATVGEITERGGPVLVRLEGDVAVAAMVTPGAIADLGLTPGTPVWASVKATEITVS